MVFEKKEYILKDGTKIVIKTPEKNDAVGLLTSIINVCKSTHNLLSEPEDFDIYLKNIKLEEDFIESFRTNNSYLLCVYLDGKIVGNCSLNLNCHIKDRHRATVGIAIEKEYQGKGIGSILFDELINIAKNINYIEQIELDVVSTNEIAKRLYTKNGFVKTGDIKRQLKLKDGSYLDGELMVLFLNK